MSLYISDQRINDLAEQARKILNASTREDAVLQALQKVVDEREKELPLEERLKVFQDRVKAIGTPNPDFDDKVFLDEMWGM